MRTPHTAATTGPVPERRHTRRAKRLVLTAVVGGVLILVGLGACCALRAQCRFSDQDLLARRPSRTFRDRYGAVVRVELGDDDCWRLPVPITDVSMHLIQASVAVEDRRFWTHAGIDWTAVCRAFISNLSCGRIVSGASTISMQLARLARPEPRSYPAKARQALRALDLEKRYGKAWIAEQYFNFAPYGGNLIGAEAAARAYFGKSASALTFAEATLLAGLPQRPSAFRLDRYLARARGRQRRVLSSLERIGHTTSEQTTIAMRRTFTDVQARGKATDADCNKLGYPMSEAHFCALATRECVSHDVRMTLDPDRQTLAREALLNQLAHLPGVRDGAAVIIENAGGAVRALVGTVDFHARPHGQVNAACVRRSPGSALKPFIYAMALDGGVIVPETRLRNSPLLYSDYRPRNYDGTFSPDVCAREALARSLNTPAVRLLGVVGVEYFVQHLERCGLRTLDRGAETYGLSLALGGGEVTLLQLTNAYAGLARGRFQSCRFTASSTSRRDVDPDAASPFSAGAMNLTVEMMSAYPLPGLTGTGVAWKTGTSNGHRDAWCIAFNDQLTVGVCLGNKNGRADKGLVGVTAAAPVVVHILRGVYRDRRPPDVTIDRGTLRDCTLCSETGLRALQSCPRTHTGSAPRGVSLTSCRTHCLQRRIHGTPREQTADAECNVLAESCVLRPPPPEILSPSPSTYAATDPPLRLEVRSVAAAEYTWFIDGRHVGTHADSFWRDFRTGTHRIACVCPTTGDTAHVTFRVR